MNEDHRSGIYRLAMALLSCALIFSPTAVRALCIDDGIANHAKAGDPASGMEQRQEKVGRETGNGDTSLHEGGSTVTDQTVGFWIEYQHPDERVDTFSPDTATGVPSPDMTTMAGFVEHGRSSYNFGNVELKGKSFPMYIPAVREYVHDRPKAVSKKWFYSFWLPPLRLLPSYLSLLPGWWSKTNIHSARFARTVFDLTVPSAGKEPETN